MDRRIAKTLGVLLLLTAIVVTQVPVSDVEAVAVASDFEMDGTKLLKYSGREQVVTIPEGVKTVGEEAFAGNDNLVKVTVSGEVESIGYRAFAGCDNLRTIYVGDGVEEIETAAFSNNKELKNVTLGAGVKKLGTGVFAGSGQLEDLTISEENQYLHFSNGILYDSEETKVYALMPAYEKGAYTLPSTVTEITGYAFWGNPYLEKISLGSGLREVPAYAFSNCMNLKEVEIPLAVRGIGAKAFEDCVNLTKVSLPDSMAQISSSAFDGCPNVEFTATPGTYSGDFAQSFKKSEVEKVEYEDVKDGQVIDPEDISDTESGEEEGETPTVPPDAHENIGGQTQSPASDRISLSDTINNKTLLGESSIVSGRAVIFIDNSQPRVIDGSVPSGIDLSNMEYGTEGGTGEGEGIQNLLADNAQKGKDFPKYTVIDGVKIASQAFYQDAELSAYEIDNGITEIGEFAFARSGLTSVTIPEGVTKIGYGAFYHCDSLNDVIIPVTVTEIEPYAFEKTPWIQKQTTDYPFTIVGDGILIAYAGSDSVVNIPGNVKQIGPNVFKDHMGITAVNIPDSVEIIGEEAFMNCRNLKTVNGGKYLVKVKDRAFMNCPLSTVTIPASMKEVGLGAYALGNGTDTVVFMGTELPVLTTGQSAKRIANQEYRTYAFSNIRNAIVPDNINGFGGTVLEAGTYGFDGVISGESGIQMADNRSGVSVSQAGGVMLSINSQAIPEGSNAMASIPGNEGTYILKVTDSEEAKSLIASAYGELYGGRTPVGLTAYDITLFDASGTVPITRLGRQYLDVQFKIPEGITMADNLHVVTLDQDGQLEAVEHRILQLEDGEYVQFTTSHFSPFGIYSYSGMNAQAVVTDGQAVFTSLSGNKDNTPDTGDDFIHPKWFMALGLFAGAVALFLYKGKSKKRI